MLFIETLIKVRMFIIGKNKSGDKLKDQWKNTVNPRNDIPHHCTDTVY